MPHVPFAALLDYLRRILHRANGRESTNHTAAARYDHNSSSRTFELDQRLADQLQDMAQQIQRPPDELANELLQGALRQHQASGDLFQRWRALSEREKQIAALVCLKYTNRQIATCLNISPETVKTHLRNVLVKFDLPGRSELRLALADWDFSAWDRPEC